MQEAVGFELEEIGLVAFLRVKEGTRQQTHLRQGKGLERGSDGVRWARGRRRRIGRKGACGGQHSA
jgi:hypothetical protein